MRDVGAVKNLYIGEGAMKEAGSNCSEFSLPRLTPIRELS